EYLEKSKNNKVWNKESHQSYLYDGLSFEVIAELHDGDFKGKHYKKDKLHPVSEYIYANGNILSRIDFKDYDLQKIRKKEYYHQDILGSTIMLTDKHGHVKERYSYDAFGSHYDGRFDRINEYGYNGKRFDATVGLYDYGFRDYKPMLGRFTTIDPIRDSNNWYVYCSNDPVNWIDPFGLCTSDKDNAKPKLDSEAWEKFAAAVIILAGAEATGLGLAVTVYGGQSIATGHVAAVLGGIFTVGIGITITAVGVGVILMGLDLVEGGGFDKTKAVIDSLIKN
ncbi:MAG: hypothetical protein KAT05_11440, partial [Spirochaetes bacterium]|nr:hypothetical protein [Spirochaetota bacterium]